jgi:DNA-binding SARP family transcriptional activator
VEREYYRRLAVQGLAALSAAYEGEGDYASALASLERALAFNPLQEDLQRESIRLITLAGDRPGAIQRL